jgi:hypothetical protein
MLSLGDIGLGGRIRHLPGLSRRLRTLDSFELQILLPDTSLQDHWRMPRSFPISDDKFLTHEIGSCVYICIVHEAIEPQRMTSI